MDNNIHSLEIQDLMTIKAHRDNLKMRISQSSIPVRDPLWQSTLEGKLIKHSDIKRIRKKYSFYTIDEIERNKNNR